MKKFLTTTMLCALAFGLGFGLSSTAFSDAANAKIGYINVSKLLESSATMKSAVATKNKQMQELQTMINNANADIKKQPADKKAAVVKKYETQINAKRDAIQTAYSTKIKQVDKQLEGVIAQKGKALGYDIVLRKDSVLWGGTDITSQILPLVK